MRNDDELDLLIDRALATYAESGRESELARRVLERIAAAAAPAPRRRWLPWAAVLAAAACALLLILVHPHARIAAPQTGQANRAALPQRPAVMAARKEPPRAPRREMAQEAESAARNPLVAAAAAGAEPLPKLDVFPSPEPLDAQERALAVFVAQTPQPELRALAKSQQQELPLTVASIHVMPLEPPDRGEN